MPTSDDLWGGSLLGVDLDPVQHDCTLRISAVDGTRTNVFRVLCRGVSDLGFQNAIPPPWNYAEVTEAHHSIDERSGKHRLEVVLWSEDAHLDITCSSVDIQRIG